METSIRACGRPKEVGPDADTDQLAAAVIKELSKILQSPQFRHCSRGKQFLDFIVREVLAGRADNLKERTIGVAVFQRAASYATGDDPIVRVEAREVRRRLTQYYRQYRGEGAIRIHLPTGSYVPEFLQDAALSSEPAGQSLAGNDMLPSGLDHPSKAEVPALTGRVTRYKPQNGWKIGFFVVVAVMAAAVILVAWHRSSLLAPEAGREGNVALAATDADATLEQFWSPALTTSQPVMIYLSKGVTYRPSAAIYEQYARTHQGAFAKQMERANNPLPLPPNKQILWKQMVLYTDYGVAAGDVRAAAKLSTFLGGLRKPEQIRIGNNFSYADLSSSPTILIGGFNDLWTMKLTSKLHFAFVDQGTRYLSIREQIPHGRDWPWPDVSKTHEDYALVTRLVDSSTGQFLVIVGGCSGPGTEAAGNFVTSERSLDLATKGLAKGWQSRNLQFVLETKVVNGIAEPARVIASYSW